MPYMVNEIAALVWIAVPFVMGGIYLLGYFTGVAHERTRSVREK